MIKKNILNNIFSKTSTNYNYYKIKFGWFELSQNKFYSFFIFNKSTLLSYKYVGWWDIDNLMLLIKNYNNHFNFNSKYKEVITPTLLLKAFIHIFEFRRFTVNVNFFFKNKFNTLLNLLNILIFNIKWVLVAAIISITYFFFSLFYIQLDFAKQIAIWYLLLIVYYLLMSTFNTFLNKYRYGKFTSAIQRFWKRTGMIFWLIEGFLFLIFFYYYLNSSQEPLYMFDYSSLNQELLIQLKTSYKSLILLSLAIYLSFILLLNINFFIYYQSLFILLLISLIVFYTLYIESYQFVYIISIFADKDWLFEDTKQLWVLEVEQNNLRVKQQYFVLCLVAKYWHFIFIFISWFFFLIKSIEVNKISITMLGYNVQNLLILYILNLLCLIQWWKYLSKKFLEITYYWFFIQYDEKFFINFFTELQQVLSNYITFNDAVIKDFTVINLASKLYFSSELVLWKFL